MSSPKGGLTAEITRYPITHSGKFGEGGCTGRIQELPRNRAHSVVTSIFTFPLTYTPETSLHTILPGVVETEKSAPSDARGMPTDTGTSFTTWCNWDVDELKSKSKEIQESNIFTTNIEGWPYFPARRAIARFHRHCPQWLQ
jgi:hypothetical protein